MTTFNNPTRNPTKIIKAILRPAYWLVLDTIDLLTGKRDSLIPPRRLIFFVGGGDVMEIGKEFFRYFVDFCDLTPEARVLDIGCGVGRMAIPLTKYLTSGTYEGFDIVPKGIDWCTKKITPRYPNFHFQLADIYNKKYSPKGATHASNYRFPYPNESFDFVYLTSVFTHMLPRDVDHYVSEINRVLKSNGKALATHFLITQESRDLISRNLSAYDLKDTGNGYWSMDRTDPEEAIGYEESLLRGLYEKYGMSIVEPIHYGSWCGRKQYLSFQDIIVAQKIAGHM